MKRDPHIRSYHEGTPHLPNWSGARYKWPEFYDDDVVVLRSYMQENGRGLFVLLKGDEKRLVEAYYPEDIRDHYAKDWLTGPQKEDYKQGRLVVVQDLLVLHTELTERHLLEFKQSNRNARRDLKRQSTSSYHLKDLENHLEAEADRDIDAVAGSIGEEFGERAHAAMRPKANVLTDIGGN